MTTLLKYWKSYLFLALLIALIIATGVAVHYYRQSKYAGQLIAAKQILKNPSVPVIDTFRDKKGILHTEVSSTANTVPQAALKDTGVKRDSVVKIIDAALNLADASHLMEVTQENMQLRAAVLKLRRDSADKALLAYNDHALSFKYDARDSTVRDFKVNLNISQVKYRRPKLFGGIPLYDFYSDDPRVTFSGIDHFTVAIQPPIFGLTADAKTAFVFNTGHVVPSVGLDFRVGNFHFGGREFYSPAFKRFQQLASVSYQYNIF